MPVTQPRCRLTRSGYAAASRSIRYRQISCAYSSRQPLSGSSASSLRTSGASASIRAASVGDTRANSRNRDALVLLWGRVVRFTGTWNNTSEHTCTVLTGRRERMGRTKRPCQSGVCRGNAKLRRVRPGLLRQRPRMRMREAMTKTLIGKGILSSKIDLKHHSFSYQKPWGPGTMYAREIEHFLWVYELQDQFFSNRWPLVMATGLVVFSEFSLPHVNT